MHYTECTCRWSNPLNWFLIKVMPVLTYLLCTFVDRLNLHQFEVALFCSYNAVNSLQEKQGLIKLKHNLIDIAKTRLKSIATSQHLTCLSIICMVGMVRDVNRCQGVTGKVDATDHNSLLNSIRIYLMMMNMICMAIIYSGTFNHLVLTFLCSCVVKTCYFTTSCVIPCHQLLMICNHSRTVFLIYSPVEDICITNSRFMSASVLLGCHFL